jgi:hypothetical protein
MLLDGRRRLAVLGRSAMAARLCMLVRLAMLPSLLMAISFMSMRTMGVNLVLVVFWQISLLGTFAGSEAQRKGDGDQAISGAFHEGAETSGRSEVAKRFVYGPRKLQRALGVSCTTISARPGSCGASFAQNQAHMFSMVGFSSPSISFR